MLARDLSHLDKPAVGRDRCGFSFKANVVRLGENDLGLIVVGDRIVVAGADLLDDIVLDAVVSASDREDQESPGFAAGTDRFRLVVQDRYIVRVVDGEDGGGGGSWHRSPVVVPLDQPG